MRRAVGSLLALVTVAVASPAVLGAPPPSPAPRAVKVLVVTGTDAEAAPWIAQLGLGESVPVPGLPAADPAVKCSAEGVCLVTTGSGKAAAAASTAAVVLGGQLDLTAAYVIVAGAASIDPSSGTLGSVAWASQVVDFGIAWEIDARALPSGWTTGYLGIGAMSPTSPPVDLFGTEVYALSAPLVAKAVALSSGAALSDDGAAQACRAPYASAPATTAPAVVACDAASSDTVWHGALLGARATAWSALLTGGAAKYCAAQQSDNATVTALERGASLGRLDAGRVVVVHAAASFDRPPPGQSPSDAIAACGAAGASIAATNLVAAARPLVSAIVSGWGAWKAGVPQ